MSDRTIAITIGNFDGVHRGHLALIRAGREAVGPAGRVAALVFEPHPLTVLRPQAAPARLSRFSQRKTWLLEAGADEVHPITPSQDFLRQSPEAFVAALAEQYAPAAIVEGPDFHFGRGRAGNVETLRHLETAYGYRTIVIDPVEVTLSDLSIVRVSSSMTRWLLAQGRVRDAAILLGRPFELQAQVVKGDQRGRDIGFPTINLDHGDCLLPADGIYAGVAVRPDGATYAAAISVGTKPTFGNSPRVCEAHLIDYNGPLNDYGWTVTLQFHDWLRDQLKYASVDALVDQLHRDIARCRILAGRYGKAQSPAHKARSAV